MTLRELPTELNALPPEALDLTVLRWDCEWGEVPFTTVQQGLFSGDPYEVPECVGLQVVVLR